MSGRGGGSIITAGAEAAKRARLERIVSSLKPAVLAMTRTDGIVLKPRNASPRGGVSGPRYAGARARAGQGSSLALAKKKLFALNHFFCELTPELSRPARCGSGRSETAKRARLERLVMQGGCATKLEYASDLKARTDGMRESAWSGDDKRRLRCLPWLWRA